MHTEKRTTVTKLSQITNFYPHRYNQNLSLRISLTTQTLTTKKNSNVIFPPNNYPPNKNKPRILNLQKKRWRLSRSSPIMNSSTKPILFKLTKKTLICTNPENKINHLNIINPLKMKCLMNVPPPKNNPTQKNKIKNKIKNRNLILVLTRMRWEIRISILNHALIANASSMRID